MVVTSSVIDRIAPVMSKQYGFTAEEKEFLIEVIKDFKSYNHWIELEEKLHLPGGDIDNIPGIRYVRETYEIMNRIGAYEDLLFWVVLRGYLYEDSLLKNKDYDTRKRVARILSPTILLLLEKTQNFCWCYYICYYVNDNSVNNYAFETMTWLISNTESLANLENWKRYVYEMSGNMTSNVYSLLQRRIDQLS